MGEEAITIATAPTDEQDVWLGAFELAESRFLVPSGGVVPDWAPGKPVSGSALKAQARSVLIAL